MNFSIRSLLAVTFLAALGLITGRAFREMRHAQSEWQTAQTLAEQEAQSNLLLTDSYRENTFHEINEDLQRLQRTRQAAKAAFEQWAQRNSQFVPRDDETLSYRLFPNLEFSQNPFWSGRFLLSVPKKRDVWLCAGSLDKDATDQFQRRLESAKSNPNSLFPQPGPYETQLAPGQHTLTIRISQDSPQSIAVEINVDDATVLRTVGKSKQDITLQMNYSNPRGQSDVVKQRRLPGLVNPQFFLNHSDGTRATQESFPIWLSDAPLNADPFPNIDGNQTRTESAPIESNTRAINGKL